jgi:molybdate transport system ATP-binding protein
MMLEVDIEKRLGSFFLHANFSVGAERLALLGASGCGKSMTLKCVAGIVKPDRGRIVLDGRTLFDSGRRVNLPPQKRHVGYLFQQYALFPNMTVEKNIRCAVRAADSREKDEAAAEKIRKFRLEGLEKKLPAQLSGGQQQRVALARILASGPRAILLDEPFSALDSFLKWNLERELSELLADFTGPVVWVSHDLDECCRNCGRVAVMENGRADGASAMEELLRRPATLGAARLTGCRNFFPAERDGDCAKIPALGLRLPGAPGTPFSIAGIPSDAIRLGGGSLACTVCSVTRDRRVAAAMLRPDGCGPEVLLCAEFPADTGLAPGGKAEIAILPEKVLYL